MRHRLTIALAVVGLAQAFVLTPASAARPQEQTMSKHHTAQARSQSHASARDNIKKAQHALARRYGGYKLDQSWRNEDLLVVWQSEDGRHLLVQINSKTGHWAVLRDESSGH